MKRPRWACVLGLSQFGERAIDWGIENLVIDPELILEFGRREEVHPTFESRDEVKQELDLWRYGTYWPKQPKRLILWYEKAAQSSIIKPACNAYVVPSLACRGDNSDTQLRLLLKQIYSDPRRDLDVEYVLGYVGDHDAPGVRMDGYVKYAEDQGDIPNRLAEQDRIIRRWAVHRALNGEEFVLLKSPASWQIRVERILVTSDDLDRDDLMTIPVNAKHPHRDEYLRLFGNRAIEADFLRSDEIQRRVVDWIESHIDAEAWQRSERNGRRLKREFLRRTETPRRLLRIEHKPGDHRTRKQKLQALAKNSGATPAERAAARAKLEEMSRETQQ